MWIFRHNWPRLDAGLCHRPGRCRRLSGKLAGPLLVPPSGTLPNRCLDSCSPSAVRIAAFDSKSIESLPENLRAVRSRNVPDDSECHRRKGSSRRRARTQLNRSSLRLPSLELAIESLHRHRRNVEVREDSTRQIVMHVRDGRNPGVLKQPRRAMPCCGLLPASAASGL